MKRNGIGAGNPADWSTAGNLSNRSSGVQIPRDICTRLKRYLYSAKCSWIIIADISYRFERAEIVTRLLERGADPLIESDNHLTPLHSAARRGLTEICRLLLRDPRLKQTAVKGKKVSPFHLACLSGNRETCELLLANGADVVMKSATHYTPLHFTAWLGNENICEFLIETGNSFFSWGF